VAYMAVWGIAREYEKSEEGFDSRALEIEADARSYIVFAIRTAAYDGEHNLRHRFVLLDPTGCPVDNIICSTGPRFVRSVKEPLEIQADGGELVVQFPFGKQRGAPYEALPTQRNGVAISIAEWKEKGLCHVAVRNGRFEVLWPPLAEK